MVEWPLGLDLILKSSLSYGRNNGALEYAIENSHDSVGLLLAAGWPISSWSLRLAACLPDKLGIFKMIVDALIKRRRFLYTLAREKLDVNEVALHNDLDDFSGESMEIIYAMLSNSVRRIDHTITIYAWECFSVYESIDCNYHAADILYEAGFTNLEKRRWLSRQNFPFYTELADYLDMCSWFHGRDSLYPHPPETSMLPIHYVASYVGLSLGYCDSTQPLREWKTAVSRHATFLKTVLVDTEHHDSCSCACSVGGCLPSTILIAEATGEALGLWSSHDAPAKLFDLLDSVTADELKEMHNILAPVVLRLFTFKKLQITHTCRYHFGEDETEGEVNLHDVPEVQAEERHLTDQLEELVFEFEDKYNELNVLLPEFLSGYWRERMDEVEAEEELFDEEEAQRIREVGVIVECPSSVPE